MDGFGFILFGLGADGMEWNEIGRAFDIGPGATFGFRIFQL